MLVTMTSVRVLRTGRIRRAVRASRAAAQSASAARVDLAARGDEVVPSHLLRGLAIRSSPTPLRVRPRKSHRSSATASFCSQGGLGQRRGNGERRTRTADTSIFSRVATSPTRHAEVSKTARVCWHFALPPATVAGRTGRRDTGGYPKIPGGLGRRAVFVGPNPNGAGRAGNALGQRSKCPAARTRTAPFSSDSALSAIFTDTFAFMTKHSCRASANLGSPTPQPRLL